MNIAIATPLLKSVPPIKYGGIERIVSQITTGIASKGHHVTLYASGGSSIDHPNVHIIPCSPYPTASHRDENRTYEMKQFNDIISHQNAYDVLHLHYEPYIWDTSINGIEFNLLDRIHIPTVITFHNSTHIEKRIHYYATHHNLNRFHYVFISKNQKKPLSFFPHTHIIYNGIPIHEFSMNENPQDYLLFLGRITQGKGLEDAIQVSKQTGKRLVIAATIDASDQEYFETTVKPEIDGKQITYIGEIEQKDKINYLRNAYALMFPISWEEPFGLVMTEAMACGTPVIAYCRGSVPEIVQDGVTGYIVNPDSDVRGNWIIKETGLRGLHRAVSVLFSQPKKQYVNTRINARARVAEKFTSDRMVKKYEQLYISLLHT